MKNEAGFSLISVIIAMVLLSVGIMSLARVGGEVLEIHSATSGRSTALAIARGHLEQIRARPAAELVSESPVKVDASGTITPSGMFTRSVDVQDVAYNLRQVKVIVDFPRARVPVELLSLAFVGAF